MQRFTRRAALAAPVAIAIGARFGASVLAQQATPAPATPFPVPTPALPVTVTDMNGAEVTVTDVSRIVPLSGDFAEIIWDLGLGANIVGTDYSAVYPAELMALPKFGVERNLNAEGILALTPTVVIGKDAAGPPEVLQQISSAGVPVFIMLEPQTIEAPIAKITSTADALGVADSGVTLAAATQSEIDAAIALAATATNQPRALIAYFQQGGVQLIAGGGTVANAMLTAAGAVDAAVEAGVMGYQPITSEALVAANPDVIITQSLGWEAIGGEEGLLAVPGVAETTAGQNKAFLVYDDELLLGMTPRTGQQLNQMVIDLHPELAQATPVS